MSRYQSPSQNIPVAKPGLCGTAWAEHGICCKYNAFILITHVFSSIFQEVHSRGSICMVNRTVNLTDDCVTSFFLSKWMRPSSRTVVSAPRPPAPNLSKHFLLKTSHIYCPFLISGGRGAEVTILLG